MLGWIKRLVNGFKRSSSKMIRGRYDAATTNNDNRRHWANADGLSADAAASPAVRRTLRNRSRYEVANNTYAKGICKTLADDVIGTGPRLQLLTMSREVNRAVELEFMKWAAATDLAGKLHTMRIALAEDGEAFGILTTNPMLASPVKLDLKLIEADQVTDTSVRPSGNLVDGILFDEYGNPVEYHVLKNHPGAVMSTGFAFDRVMAADMIHLYRADRPGQSRGVPELTPALHLFAQLRRYTLAVLSAAETAADFAGIIYSDSPATEAADVAPLDTIELERGMMMTLPAGWKMGQAKAEQPTTTYADFKKEILNEIARALSMPYNVAAGNSSGYNYASGRLDHQTYFKSIRVDQQRFAAKVLDRILDAWMREAVLISGLLPQPLRMLGAEWPHKWFFDGHEHVDPAKEANAQAKRLKNNTTTLADEYARHGQDWESQLRQRAKEKALMQELGLEDGDAMPAETQRENQDDNAS